MVHIGEHLDYNNNEFAIDHMVQHQLFHDRHLEWIVFVKYMFLCGLSCVNFLIELCVMLCAFLTVNTRKKGFYPRQKYTVIFTLYSSFEFLLLHFRSNGINGQQLQIKFSKFIKTFGRFQKHTQRNGATRKSTSHSSFPHKKLRENFLLEKTFNLPTPL